MFPLREAEFPASLDGKTQRLVLNRRRYQVMTI
jgi:hypothetical protein